MSVPQAVLDVLKQPLNTKTINDVIQWLGGGVIPMVSPYNPGFSESSEDEIDTMEPIEGKLSNKGLAIQAEADAKGVDMTPLGPSNAAVALLALMNPEQASSRCEFFLDLAIDKIKNFSLSEMRVVGPSLTEILPPIFITLSRLKCLQITIEFSNQTVVNSTTSKLIEFCSLLSREASPRECYVAFTLCVNTHEACWRDKLLILPFAGISVSRLSRKRAAFLTNFLATVMSVIVRRSNSSDEIWDVCSSQPTCFLVHLPIELQWFVGTLSYVTEFITNVGFSGKEKQDDDYHGVGQSSFFSMIGATLTALLANFKVVSKLDSGLQLSHNDPELDLALRPWSSFCFANIRSCLWWYFVSLPDPFQHLRTVNIVHIHDDDASNGDLELSPVSITTCAFLVLALPRSDWNMVPLQSPPTAFPLVLSNIENINIRLRSAYILLNMASGCGDAKKRETWTQRGFALLNASNFYFTDVHFETLHGFAFTPSCLVIKVFEAMAFSGYLSKDNRVEIHRSVEKFVACFNWPTLFDLLMQVLKQNVIDRVSGACILMIKDHWWRASEDFSNQDIEAEGTRLMALVRMALHEVATTHVDTITAALSLLKLLFSGHDKMQRLQRWVLGTPKNKNFIVGCIDRLQQDIDMENFPKTMTVNNLEATLREVVMFNIADIRKSVESCVEKMK